MKPPKPLIASLGILMIGVTPLLQAAPGGPDDQRQGGQQHEQGRSGNQGGNSHAQSPAQNGQRGGPQGSQAGQRPPQDFGPVRQTIQEHRGDFGRGNPPPSNIHVMKGQPMPRGYGKRLDNRALAHLPHYEGYEWRRLGTDVVLIAIGTGVVYEILSGVLN